MLFPTMRVLGIVRHVANWVLKTCPCRLTSVQHDNQSLGSMQSTQSEPPKLLVSRSPDNRPVLDEPPITKSKSAEE